MGKRDAYKFTVGFDSENRSIFIFQIPRAWERDHLEKDLVLRRDRRCVLGLARPGRRAPAADTGLVYTCAVQDRSCSHTQPPSTSSVARVSEELHVSFHLP